MIAVFTRDPPTEILAPVLIRTGENKILFHGVPLAIIVRLLVGIMSDDPDWMRLRLPVPGVKVIPVAVAPLRNTDVPVNVAEPPPTNNAVTFTIRVTESEILPEVSALE